MIDIHSHILPGVDDGSKSLTDSIEMLKIAVAGGITTQVLTPHIHFGRFENTKADLQQRFSVFKEQVRNVGIAVTLKLGAEVRIGPEIMQLVKQDAIPWLGEYQGRKTFLLEFPRHDVPFGSDNLIKWLLANNCLPIIVHPERNRTFLTQRHKLQTLIDLECPLQITASSLIGKFGEDVKKMAHELLNNGDAKLVASDCHNLKGRAPDLTDVLKTLPEEQVNVIHEATIAICN